MPQLVLFVRVLIKMKTSSSEESKSNEESGSGDAVFDRIRSLFGEAITEALLKEEINELSLIEDLAERDADAPIFSKLGLTYGKAVRFKKEFGRKLPKKIGCSSRPSSPAPSKPTMAEMANFPPEMRLLYLSKRKKIGILATDRWGDDCPKFNTPEAKSDLNKFCAEIAPECSIPEIDFNEEGIASHIKTFFIEQRRYKKNKKPPGITKAPTHPRKKKKEGHQLSVEDDTGSSEQDPDQGGDTESVDTEEDSDPATQPSPLMSPLTSPLTQQSPVDKVATEDTRNSPLSLTNVDNTSFESNLKGNQIIVKGVFGRVLTRDEIIDVLKKKFNVQQKNLTGLKPTEAMAVLAKKLTRNEYCKLKVQLGDVKKKDDITVLREIAL